MTHKEYAEHLGISRQAVSKLVKLGKIPTGKGGIDPKEADKALAGIHDPARAHLRKSRPRVEGKPQKNIKQQSDSITWQQARTKKEYYQAALAKIEFEKAIGKLADAETWKEKAFKSGRVVRDAMQNIPDRISGVLAAESSQEKVHKILEKEIREALETIPC